MSNLMLPVFLPSLSPRACHARMHTTQSLGASGAIFGVLGAEAILLLVGPRGTVGAFLASIANTALFALIVAFLVPNIDHMGHAGVSP